MTPVVGQLLVINLAAYYLLARPGTPLYFELWLVPIELLQRPWTLITYQFLHASTGHVLFNMLALFFLGPRLELRLGRTHFLGLYLFSGLVGALVHMAWTALPLTPAGLAGPMVGASACVYGVLLGYAYHWPRERLLLWFVFPIEVRVLVIGFTLISLWLGLGGVADGIAHFAHLGGFLGGWLYLKWKAERSPAKQFKKRAESPAVRMGERDLRRRWTRIDPSSLHPVNRETYERISEKIDADGWSSLSDRERTFLERFGGGEPGR